MRKKLLLIFAVIAIVAAAAFALFGQRETAGGKQVIKIGVILPLSGGASEMGNASLNGARLALKEISDGGKYKYEFIVENIEMNVRESLPVYRKMRDMDKISALITLNSGVGLALRDETTKDKILHLSSSTDKNIANNKFSYINSYDIGEMIITLANHIKSDNIGTISIATINNAASAYFKGFLESKLKDAKVAVKNNISFMYGDRDFKAAAAKIARNNPDAVFLYSTDPELSLFAKELKLAGYKGKLVSIIMFGYSNNKELFEGAHFVDINAGGNDGFIDAYRTQFGAAPQSTSAAFYDNVQILAQFFEKYGLPSDFTTSEIQPKLKSIIDGYQGANGKIFMNSDGVIYSTPVMKTIRNGKVEVIK
jgi:branched-chain amino acid transport system substrate-binding protein